MRLDLTVAPYLARQFELRDELLQVHNITEQSLGQEIGHRFEVVQQ